MNELVRVEIESFGNENVVSSRVIAEGLSKRHADIIKQIEKILPNENVRSGISLSNYVDSNNQLRKQYLLTKDGFIFYMFNIQGYSDFKMAYINKFNEMEKQLSVPKTYAEALLEAGRLALENEKLEAKNEKQKQVILDYEPKVSYYDRILSDTESSLTVSQISKDYGLSAKRLNEILHEQKFQYKSGKQWLLYQNYTGKGYTKSITWEKNGKSGIYTKFTQKGRVEIHNLLEKAGVYATEDMEV